MGLLIEEVHIDLCAPVLTSTARISSNTMSTKWRRANLRKRDGGKSATPLLNANPLKPATKHQSMKTGVCHLCGETAELSFEHVPPEAAFNDQRILESDIHKL